MAWKQNICPSSGWKCEIILYIHETFIALNHMPEMCYSLSTPSDDRCCCKMKSLTLCQGRKCAKDIQAKHSCDLDGITRWFSRICTLRIWGLEWGVRIMARPVIPLRCLLMERGVLRKCTNSFILISKCVQNKYCQLSDLASAVRTVPWEFSHDALRLFTLLFYLKSYTGVYLVGR